MGFIVEGKTSRKWSFSPILMELTIKGYPTAKIIRLIFSLEIWFVNRHYYFAEFENNEMCLKVCARS